MEFFRETDAKAATVNDILKYYVEHCEKDSPLELKKARHAIYLKANRLATSGELVTKSGKGREVVFALPQRHTASEELSNETNTPDDERALLAKRESELQFDLETCIAEARGYEDMMQLIPARKQLLIKKKEEAKSRAIQLTGLLASTQKMLQEISK